MINLGIQINQDFELNTKKIRTHKARNCTFLYSKYQNPINQKYSIFYYDTIRNGILYIEEVLLISKFSKFNF